MTFYIIDNTVGPIHYNPESDWRNPGPVERTASTKAFDDQPPLPDDKAHNSKQKPFDLMREHDHVDRAFSSSPSPILACQVMTHPVVTLEETEPLIKAADIFVAKRFRHLPIVDSQHRLIGILSDRLVMRLIIKKHLTRKSTDYLIKDAMVTRVFATDPMTEVGQIAKILIKEKIGSMPITDKDHILQGILTRSDLLRLLVRVTPSECRV